MDNKTSLTDKTINALRKELESLSDSELHDLFICFYRLNHQHENMIFSGQFYEFLGSFDENPFKIVPSKTFRKQMIENLIKYAFDHMSLLTAATLIKKNFTVEEVINGYYSNINAFDADLFY